MNNLEDDDNDLAARKAFEALLRVSLLQPTSPNFAKFADEVRKIANDEYKYDFYEGEEVSLQHMLRQ
jgi:atrial natriuretic peptide receptor A